MKDDYLWNKTSEPDDEVRELEDILKVLRYQPRPLELPEELVLGRRRNFKPLLAIAATLVIALLATGLWLALRSEKKVHPTASVKDNRLSSPAPQTPSTDPARHEEQAINQGELQRPLRSASNVKRVSHRHLPNSNQSIALHRQREEAAAAKEQLLLALRVASEKLSQAQRKAQGPGAANQIRNQHKIG